MVNRVGLTAATRNPASRGEFRKQDKRLATAYYLCNATAAAQSHHPFAFVAGALLVLAGGLACGGESSASRTPASPPGLTATTEGRFLVATPEGIFEVSPSGRKSIFEPEGGTQPADPALSPDGKLVVFTLYPSVERRPDGSIELGSDLYVTGAPENGASPLVRHEGQAEYVRYPEWSRDGGRLFFEVRGQDETGRLDLRIEALEPANGRRERVLDWAGQPSLSPDGGVLAAVGLAASSGAQDIVLFDLQTRELTSLLGDRSSKLFIGSVAWSPDGKTVAFAAADPSSSFEGSGGGLRAAAVAHPTLQDVWLVNTDGSNLRRLADLAESLPSLGWSEDGLHLYSLGLTGFWKLDVRSGEKEKIGEGVYQGQIILLK